MTSWEKKIKSGGGKDLLPGETLDAGVLLNPPGMTGTMIARSLGGVIGGALHDKFGTDGDAEELSSDTGIAAQFPDKPVWLALTPTRLLVWGHSTFSGKPKGLALTLARTDLNAVDLDKQKTCYLVTLRFADGSARMFEAPKMMNDPVGFASVASGVTQA